ncbi:MAG: sigma-70 family RNA polymerase sigma factor [Acidobacteriota bacterium]|nr:sigma-70 family RNA polymerase sigma factor [Acidobacteriota bacterium]
MNRNEAFWSKAYEKHYAPLCSRARRRLTGGDHAEAEDVVSEAYLRAMRCLSDPEVIINLFAYLWVAAKRVFFEKRLRENTANMARLEDLVEAGSDPAVEPDAIRALENREFEEAIRVLRGPLNAREKTLLGLYLRGYSCDEIAAALREDVRATRSDLSAVRIKVRYRLMRGMTKGPGQS